MEQQVPFGSWLKERRNALDLAQWELANRVGCSRDTIQKIESGSRRPSKQVAELLAATLDIPLHERNAFVKWARLDSPSTRLLPKSVPVPTSAPSSVQTGVSALLTNLPVPLTSLVGRQHAIEAVRGYVLREDVRLLTLIGPPGVGKTRLSIAAAATLGSAFKDGIQFVALETIADPDLVPTAIADSLKIKPLADRSMLDAIAQHIHARCVLLVLDNFEQVLDAGQQVLELLRVCPQLKVLVTSRETLHVHGEWRFVVRPLRLPDVGRPSGLALDEVSHVASVALFTQRAKAIKSDFELTQGNAKTVTTICARLDGLPLAIELAATRVSALSPKEILSGLGQLKLLHSNLRNLPPRQRTIRAAIDWSYHMLPPLEQALFRRLGVFVGGCTRSAAEAVCNPSDLNLQVSASGAGWQVTEECQSLIEKSLLRHVSGKAGEDAEDRYAMLEVIREYAVEQLKSSGEENQIRRRHAQYYLTLAEAAFPRLYGPEQGKSLQELEADNDNIRAALAWAIEGGRETLEIALRLSGALGRFWDMRGYASEGRRWLEQALNASHSVLVDAVATGDRSAAETISPLVRIKALTAAGGLAAVQGERLAARSFYQQALEGAQAAGHRTSIGNCLMNLANASNRLGEDSEAMALYEQALLIFRELGDRSLLARTLVNMGFCARSQGDIAKARALYEESLALRRELGDQYGIALALGNLGEIAVEEGENEQARGLLEASLSIRREIRNEQGIAFCMTWLARLASAEHRFAQAGDLFQQGLRLYQKVGDREGLASCLEQLAELCMSTRQIERGVSLWAAGEALRQLIHVPIPLANRARYEQAVARARAELGEEAFAHAWTEGKQMTTESAVDHALDLTSQLLAQQQPGEK